MLLKQKAQTTYDSKNSLLKNGGRTMKWSVGTKIGAGYVLALTMLVTFGVISYWNVIGLIEAARLKTHTYDVLQNLESVITTLKDAETGQRGYLITGDDQYLTPYQAATERSNRLIRNLRSLTSDNPDQQHRLDSIEPLIAFKLAELKETIDLRKGRNGFEAALKIVLTNKGKNAMDSMRRLISEMVDEENKLLKLRDSKMNARSQTTIFIITYGIPFAFALLALIGFLVTRTITNQLRESIALLSSSSSEILATTTQVASGSAETATAVSETTSTVEEVRQTVELASQKAKQVSENAQKTAQITQSGRQAVEELITGMNRIREQTALAADSIVKLSEQSQTIGEIIVTVNDLAEQSNLLAVNAAIEASKAGEQGKGFAVVAQEIKSLAAQSKQATAQVRVILGGIQKATGTAVMATDLSGKAVEAGAEQSDIAGEAIRLLAENFTESAQAALQIAASSQQQLIGMDQVALAMANIKQASAQNTAGTRQAETAAQNLHELGLKLKLLV